MSKRETWRGLCRLGEVSIAGGRVLRVELVEHIALGIFVELRICQDGTLTNERVRVRIGQIVPVINLLSKAGREALKAELAAGAASAGPWLPNSPTGKAAAIAGRLGD